MLGSDEPQPEKEAAESVLFVIYSLPLGGNPLLVPGHCTQSGNKGGVGVDFFGSAVCREPIEGKAVIQQIDGQVGNAQGLFDEAAFGIDQVEKVLQGAFCETGHGHLYGDAFWLLIHNRVGLGVVIGFGDTGVATGCQPCLDCFHPVGVCVVIQMKDTVFVDGDPRNASSAEAGLWLPERRKVRFPMPTPA